MNYAKIRKLDVTNGPGVRTTLFVSGCTHNCKGCFNKEAQNFNYGKQWTKEVEEEFLSYVKRENVVGVNILGGEPLQQNTSVMLNLLKRIKKETNKSIWMWTGYTIEEIFENKEKCEILKYVDVLIDGRFQLENRDLMLKYRGSINQRVIDVSETLKKGKVTLLEKNKK